MLNPNSIALSQITTDNCIDDVYFAGIISSKPNGGGGYMGAGVAGYKNERYLIVVFFKSY